MHSQILKSIFLLFFVVYNFNAQSEIFNDFHNPDTCDYILLISGEEISCKVIEIGIYVIKYKKCTNLEGPIYSIKKTDVFMIKYINGEKDVMLKVIVDENKEKNITEIDQPDISINKKLIASVLDKKQYSEEKYSGINEVKIGDIVKYVTPRGFKVYGIVSGFKDENKVIFNTYPSPSESFEWQANYKWLKKIKY